jgi:hypothetical protein
MSKLCPTDSRDQELNKRIFERNIPSHTIEPVFSVNPVATRYTKMHIMDNNENNLETPIAYKNQYQTSTTFYPGDRKPNWNGFVTNVDKESQLRNQFFALQKCDQAYYIPETKSDLYVNHNIPTGKKHENSIDEKEPLVFQQQRFENFNPNIFSVGNLLFNNSTRVQRNEGV